MIKKTSSGYEILNHTGTKKLSKPNMSKKAAEKRLGQIEYFKNKGKK